MKKVTQFMDMHSGGGSKEKWGNIYIEAPEEEAIIIFYNRFGHNPNRVTCTCCGNDYSISECDDILQATAFHRGCRYAYIKDGVEIPESEGWIMGEGIAKGVEAKYIEEHGEINEYKTIDQYFLSDDALFIKHEDIKDDERVGDVPEQGYCWID